MAKGPQVRLPGEVHLAGKLVYSGLTPRFTETGLSVWRLSEDGLSVEGYGPHFDFHLPSAFLLANLGMRDLVAGASFSLSGTCLGCVEMMKGRLAVEADTV